MGLSISRFTGGTPNWVNYIQSTGPAEKIAGGSLLGTAGLGIGLAGLPLDAYFQYKNYRLQKDQYEYEKRLQNTIFQREDNATQRRVADLRAAGLSPVLAAGSPAGSGAVVSTEAPQIGKTNLTEQVLAAINMMKMEADISRTRAEEDFIRVQANNAKMMLPHNVALSKAQRYNQLQSGSFAGERARSAGVVADVEENTGMPNTGLWNQIINGLAGWSERARQRIMNNSAPQNNQRERIPRSGPRHRGTGNSRSW